MKILSDKATSIIYISFALGKISVTKISLELRTRFGISHALAVWL